MGLFGKSREEQAQERSAEASAAAIKEVTSTFQDEFVGWLARVDQEQSDTRSDELTSEILGKVGALPTVGNSSTPAVQYQYGRGFAQSFTAAQLKRRNTRAYVEAMDAEKAGNPEAKRLNDAVAYWESVNSYVEANLR
jgi:hypothetical protein